MAIVPLCSVLAALAFLKASRNYEADLRAVADVHLDVADPQSGSDAVPAHP